MSEALIDIYSDSLPADKQALVRRIQPVTEGTRFRTRVCLPVEEEGGADWQSGHKSFAWREARKEPETGLWSVIHYKNQTVLRFDTEFGPDQDGGADDVTIRRDVLETGLCFFDALYACASFEVSFDQAGYQAIAPQPSPQELGGQYYRHFAEAQGIVFHKKTLLPVPVADTEILDESVTLGLKDIDIAERSRGNLAAQDAVTDMVQSSGFGIAGPAGQDGQVPPFLGNALVKVGEATRQGRDLVAVNKTYQKSQNKLSRLSHSYENLQTYKGRRMTLLHDVGTCGHITGLSYLIGFPMIAAGAALAPLTAGGSMPFLVGGAAMTVATSLAQLAVACTDDERSPLYISQNLVRLPRRDFKRGLKTLYKDAARWPEDSPQRKAGTWLARQFDVAGHAVAARYDFEKALQKGSWLAERRSRASLDQLGAACIRCEIPENEQNQIFARVLDKTPESNLAVGMKHRMESCMQHYQKVMADLKQQEIIHVKKLPGPS